MNVGLLYAGLATTLGLAASGAGTLTFRAGALARLRPAVTLGLAVTDAVDVGLLLARLTTALALLQVSQVAGFVVNIHDGLVALVIESPKLLASGCSLSLVKVTCETSPGAQCLVGDAKLLVHNLRLLRSLCLRIDVLESLEELGAVAVLLIGGEGAFDGLVRDGVAVCKVLSNNTSARLLLLRDIITLVVVVDSNLLSA